jgi:hypothetical protein
MERNRGLVEPRSGRSVPGAGDVKVSTSLVVSSMRKRILRSALFAGCLPLGCIVLAFSADRIPLQAELLRAVEAGRVKVGDPVLAKVTVKWQSPQCALREGAILNGHIVAQKVHSKTEKTSEIALVFDSGQCGGVDLKPLPMTVAAVLAGDPARDKGMYENQPLSEAVGLGLGSGGGGPNGTGGGATGKRSVMQAAATVYVSPPRYKGPTTVLPGQVIGIRGMTLNVGGGPEGSSILSTSGHNARLEAGAQFLLSPNLNVVSSGTATVTPSVAVPSVSTNTGKATEEVVPSDETEICSPPQCSVALSSSQTEATLASASSTFSLTPLGYTAVRSDHAMYSFDYGSAISYLGPKELLFTFNPHILVPRTGAETGFAKLRIVRAVLIDIEDRKVVKTVDWKVSDASQYLWPIGQNRVLVHVGKELKLYGSGLKQEQRLVLNGPLAFVRSSPSSKYLAVSVVQERHSDTVHRQLVDAEDRDPEEDVEVKVLDHDFHILATVLRSSRAPFPVLSENGEIQVISEGKTRWQIVEESWDTQKHVLAKLNSNCKPATTALPPDLLFVVGCDRRNNAKWYRVLRPDGKPVLNGSSSSDELEQVASGAASGSAFTVGMAKAAKSIAFNTAFSSSDLESERIAVYRSDNGGKLFSLTVPSPAPTMQTFVLSPAGNQLAVLAGDQIAFYKVLGN